MHSIFMEYGESLSRLGKSKTACQHARRYGTLLTDWCQEQGHDPATVPGWALEEFIASQPYTPETKRTVLRSLRAAYHYAQKRGVIDVVPTSGVKVERPPDRPPRVLSNQALRDLLAACVTDRDWLMLHLFIYTGMRRTEVRNLRWEEVDLATRTFRVVGKGGKYRIVPIHPAIGEILGPLERKTGPLLPSYTGAPLGEGGLYHALSRLTEDREIGFHDFRRTFASSLYRNGVQEGIIDRICGWGRTTMAMKRYIHIADDDLRHAVLRAYADDPL